jgi:hypothetical protein
VATLKLEVNQSAATLAQRSAWQRLWAILLAPIDPIASEPGSEDGSGAPGATEAASMDERDGERSAEGWRHA